MLALGKGLGPRHARHARPKRACAWLRVAPVPSPQEAPPLPCAVLRDGWRASGRRASRHNDAQEVLPDRRRTKGCQEGKQEADRRRFRRGERPFPPALFCMMAVKPLGSSLKAF